MTRRRLLCAAGGVALLLQWRPVAAVSATDSLQTVVTRWAAGRPVRAGRINFDIAPLVENGNVVPITVSVDSPMSPSQHVVSRYRSSVELGLAEQKTSSNGEVARRHQLIRRRFCHEVLPFERKAMLDRDQVAELNLDPFRSHSQCAKDSDE